MIRTNRYPDGKSYAVTMSYDDGLLADRKLIEIFNTYGIKGTFHLISGRIGTNPAYVTWEELPTLYAGHEIACHSVEHPHLEQMPANAQYEQLIEDRKALEAAAGKLVRGFSFPFGTWSAATLDAMKTAGLEYGRTTNNTNNFLFPENFLLWHPTCHHKDCERHVDQMIYNIEKAPWRAGGMLYIWGHSYEFNNDNNWDLIERVCQKLSNYKDSIWFATNVEIMDYKKAVEQLKVSADGKKLYNPTATDIWVDVDDAPVKVPAGETVVLA